MSVKARLNHGRWLADCPDCNGAEIVRPGYRFICGSSKHGTARRRAFYIQLAIIKADAAGENFIYADDQALGIPLKKAHIKVREYADGFDYDVVWPDDTMKTKIESLASERPVQARNWPVAGNIDDGFYFSEPITAMREENERHGLGSG